MGGGQRGGTLTIGKRGETRSVGKPLRKKEKQTKIGKKKDEDKSEQTVYLVENRIRRERA